MLDLPYAAAGNRPSVVRLGRCARTVKLLAEGGSSDSAPVDNYAFFCDPDRGISEIYKIRFILDRELPGALTFRRSSSRRRFGTIDPGFSMTGVGRNRGPTVRSKLLLYWILETVDLKVLLQMRASREPPNNRPVVRSPVELRLLQRLTGRMTQRKENLHQAAARTRNDLFRRIDLRIFVSEPERRIRQVDESRFVFDQLLGGGLPRRAPDTRR